MFCTQYKQKQSKYIEYRCNDLWQNQGKRVQALVAHANQHLAKKIFASSAAEPLYYFAAPGKKLVRFQPPASILPLYELQKKKKKSNFFLVLYSWGFIIYKLL
jgi:hypothetical protein